MIKNNNTMGKKELNAIRIFVAGTISVITILITVYIKFNGIS